MKIDAYIGDEIRVVVEFDWTAPEAQTLTDPSVQADVDITLVLVNGDDRFDIYDVLSGKCLDSLEMQCFEYMGEGYDSNK